MIISNIPNLSSMSMVKAKVDLYNGSTLVKTCTCGDVLSDFTVTREGETGKFFGFGICHKLDIHFIDINRELAAVTKGNTAEIGLGDGGSYWDTPYPTFYITEIEKDEKASTISGTAYDKLYAASEYLFEELPLGTSYTLMQVAQAIAVKLGVTLNVSTSISSAFALSYAAGANLEGSEDLRSVLNWIAEATQTIYFINSANELVFKRLDRDGAAVASITKEDYYELNTSTPRTLEAVCNATELGDNIEASTGSEGDTQYIRNNPFLELREDLPTILNTAVDIVGGITITQFSCEWAGNYLLEIGDKLSLETDNSSEVYSFLLSDTVSYAGTLDETTGWTYEDEKSDTHANPINLGERLNQTYAKVDKVNKRVDIVVSDVTETKENVASLVLTTDAINLKVTEHEEKIEAFEELDAGQLIDRVAQIELDLDSIDLTVSNQTTKITTLETTTQNQGTAIDDLTADVEANTSDIDGLTATTETHTSQISTLSLNADSIAASVQKIESTITEAHDAINDNLETLTKEVNLKMTEEDVNLAISTTLENGIDKVKTTTGFTFDNNGLTISRSDSEIDTTISEDGMTIKKGGNDVLVADNQGVKAEDLHATTYLIIGTNSRFENRGNDRTACFWIGG